MLSLNTSRMAQTTRFGLALIIALHACACVTPRPGAPASSSWVRVLSVLAAAQ